MSGRIRFTSEADIAKVVMAEMQRQGFETYQEVSIGRGGAKRADIVGVRGPILMVVETKANLSLALLEQLFEWRSLASAHYTVGAVPSSRYNRAARRFLRDHGLGLWGVGTEDVREEISPQLWRRIDGRLLRDVLRDEQRSGQYAEAGSRSGGYFTPFRGTVDELERYAWRNPGCELREALANVKHHYASRGSALTAIPALIRKGVITRLRVEGKPLRLYPVEAVTGNSSTSRVAV